MFKIYGLLVATILMIVGFFTVLPPLISANSWDVFGLGVFLMIVVVVPFYWLVSKLVSEIKNKLNMETGGE